MGHVPSSEMPIKVQTCSLTTDGVAYLFLEAWQPGTLMEQPKKRFCHAPLFCVISL